MKEKVTFNKIWKSDSRVRMLAGGMLADGMLLTIMIALAAYLAIL